MYDFTIEKSVALTLPMAFTFERKFVDQLWTDMPFDLVNVPRQRTQFAVVSPINTLTEI